MSTAERRTPSRQRRSGAVSQSVELSGELSSYSLRSLTHFNDAGQDVDEVAYRRFINASDGVYREGGYRPSSSFFRSSSPSGQFSLPPGMVATHGVQSAYIGSLRNDPPARAVPRDLPREVRGLDFESMSLASTALSGFQLPHDRSTTMVSRTYKHGQGPYDHPPTWSTFEGIMYRREWTNPYPEDSPLGRAAACKRALALKERSKKARRDEQAAQLVHTLVDSLRLTGGPSPGDADGRGGARARTPSSSRPQSRGVSPRGTYAAMSYHPAASPSPLDGYNTSAPFRASPTRARAAVTLSGSVFGSREGSPQKAHGGAQPGRFRAAGGGPDSPDAGSRMSLEGIVRQREAVAREQARLAAEWRQLEELSRRLEASGAASDDSGSGGGAGSALPRAGEPASAAAGGPLPGTVAFSPLGSGVGFGLEEEVEAINAATEAAVQAALNLQLSPSPSSSPARRGERPGEEPFSGGGGGASPQGYSGGAGAGGEGAAQERIVGIL